MYSKVLVCAYIKLATYKEYYNEIFEVSYYISFRHQQGFGDYRLSY